LSHSPCSQGQDTQFENKMKSHRTSTPTNEAKRVREWERNSRVTVEWKRGSPLHLFLAAQFY
jgi:hypothetical protein